MSLSAALVAPKLLVTTGGFGAELAIAPIWAEARHIATPPDRDCIALISAKQSGDDYQMLQFSPRPRLIRDKIALFISAGYIYTP